mgnify:CR=1 FL=1
MVDLPTTSDPEELTRLRIERLAHELDDNGLSIVPRSVAGLSESLFIELRKSVLGSLNSKLALASTWREAWIEIWEAVQTKSVVS